MNEAVKHVAGEACDVAAGTSILRGQGSAKVIVSKTGATRLKCRSGGEMVLRS
jgi:hypothetical protein